MSTGVAAFPDQLELGPLDRAAGVVRLPGSKSISNRTLLLAALAHGRTRIYDLLAADDVERMLDALGTLRIQVEQGRDGGHVEVTGAGGAPPVKQAELFLGNAGTAFRPLTAALAFSGGRYTLSGVPRMHERPIGDLVDALRSLGADIRYLGKEGYPPLEIGPAAVRRGGAVRVRGDVSSQFLTALLIASPLVGGEISIEVEGELVSKPYVDITLNLMARFGVKVGRRGWTSFMVPPDSRYVSPGEIFVEGDASGASYFLAAGAIGGGPVRVDGVGSRSIQGDVQFADALASMGARLEMGDNWIEARAPAGRLRGFDLDLNHIPDAAMTLAVAALFAEGPSRLRNIASWRVKETDRIAAMAIELRKLGAHVEEGADFLAITPPAGRAFAANAEIDTYEDHRMAMCFSLAALGRVPVRINDPQCVAKTFPEYFKRFASLTWNSAVPVVAIDGPSASGKGTVAQDVAARLGFRYLDSGALYRLVALAAVRAGQDLRDEQGLGALASDLAVAFRRDRIWLADEDVTEAIRTEEVSTAASRVAAIPLVRQGLMQLQRSFRTAPGLVADGRDMGTVVFPDAVLKVFLTASLEERARRRYKQLIDKGFDANLATLLQDLRQRDQRDSTRGVAPLQQSAEAQVLDTTGISVEEATSRVIRWYEQARPRVPSR